MRPLGVRSPHAVRAAPPPARRRGRGVGPSPPAAAHPSPACCQAPVSLPLPRAELPRDTVRPLSECSLGGEVPPTCVSHAHPPPGAPHKGDLGSGGQPAPDTERPGPAPRLRRGGHARGPAARPPRRPPVPPPRVSGVRHYQPTGWRGPTGPTAPFRGVSPHPAGKSGAPGEPAEGDSRMGKAAAGRFRRRRRPAPGSRALPAGWPSDRGALPAPRAPACAAPAHYCRRRRRRGSTAFCVPVGVGRSPTERQTRQPNRHRFYLAPPSNQAPPRLAGRKRAPVQSQGPPGVEAPSQPHAEAPAGLGRARPVARVRVRAAGG